MKIKTFLKWSGTAILFLVLLAALGLFIAYWRSTNDCFTSSTAVTHPMKAIRFCEYGSPEVLNLEEIEKPVPTDSEVLVKVRAVSVNPVDGVYTGAARLITGLRKPRSTRMGTDFSGTVEAVGKNVTQFKAGDDVFGGARGSFAEYVCVREERGITLKPANVTFEQAASVPVAGVTALQGLRDKGKIQSRQKVLINGASGGVGTFAVQIAKSYGTEVTGVCSTRNLEMVRSLGADRVIDYTKEDFTANGQRYDLLFDIVGNHSFSERRGILNPKGICVMAGLGGAGWHEDMGKRLLGELNALVLSRFVSQNFNTFLARLDKKDLTILADLMQSGKVTPVIDRTYKLSEAREAIRYLDTGHARGKVVVEVE